MILIMLILTLILNSCALDEYTHMKAPEVSSCILDKSCIQVVFSSKMQKELTESAFTCSSGTVPEAGAFVWEKNRMYFFPASGIKEKSLYEVEIGTRAEDVYGNSLKEPFSCTFSTGGDGNQLVVQKMNISEGEVVTDLLKPFQIDFSKPVEKALFYQQFSISPAVKGNIAIKNNGMSVIFTPQENLEWNTVYTLTAGEKKVMFSTPEEPKAILSYIQIKDGVFLQEQTIQHGVEKDAVLILSYSAPVSGNETASPLTISPYQSYTPVWNSSYTQCTVTFDKSLPFKTLLEVRTRDSRQYLLYVDGDNSVPPSVNCIRFYQDYSTGESSVLEYGSGLVFETGDQACFEIEFSVGENAFLYPADAYDAIDIEVALGDLVISPRHLETRKVGSSTAFIRIFCSITAGTSQTPVIISIDSKLQDSEKNSLGNSCILRINSL